MKALTLSLVDSVGLEVDSGRRTVWFDPLDGGEVDTESEFFWRRDSN
ncbi:MAG: hypothetical protein NT072_08370 [Deltaproteobacteria bacterium]|nr:hypothetical protein [Deltaproteobacteria bacterium]